MVQTHIDRILLCVKGSRGPQTMRLTIKAQGSPLACHALAYCPSMVLCLLQHKSRTLQGPEWLPALCFPPLSILPVVDTLGLRKPVTPDDLPSPAGLQSPKI